MSNPSIFLDVQAEAKSLGTFKKQLLELVKEPLKVKIDIDKDSVSKFQKQIKDLTDAAEKAGSISSGNGRNGALKNTEAQLLKIEAIQARITTQMAKAYNAGMIEHSSVQAIGDATVALEQLEKRVRSGSATTKDFNSVMGDVQSKLSSATTIIKFYAGAQDEAAAAATREMKAQEEATRAAEKEQKVREDAAKRELKAQQELNRELKAIGDMRNTISGKLNVADSLDIRTESVANLRNMLTELDRIKTALLDGKMSTDQYKVAMSDLQRRLSENAHALKPVVDYAKEKAKADRKAAVAAKQDTAAAKENTEANSGRAEILKLVGNGLNSLLTKYISFQAIVRLIREMAQASIQLDSAFTQLKIVTGATEDEMAKFERTAYSMSKRLGQSATDVTKSIEVFSRLGYSLQDASKLAEYASILSNVAAVSNEEATTGLTSIIKGFNMQVSNAEHVSDVLIQVGQKYAVSAGEIMEAFEKSGAALNATGTSFEKAAGLIAAANASVQNAGTVGRVMPMRTVMCA